MAIKPPNWAKNAVPTPQGWRNARTGELLVSTVITPAQIAEYYGEPADTYQSAPQPLNEAPPLEPKQWFNEVSEQPAEKNNSWLKKATSFFTE